VATSLKLQTCIVSSRHAIERLKRGEVVEGYREGGNSMVPLICHREPVTLAPVDTSKLEKGDIVLVKVRGRTYTHKVSAMRKGQVQISNNKGHVNGWTRLENVFGIVTEVDGRPVSGAEGKTLRLQRQD